MSSGSLTSRLIEEQRPDSTGVVESMLTGVASNNAIVVAQRINRVARGNSRNSMALRFDRTRPHVAKPFLSLMKTDRQF